ncbi:TIGR01777 family oxidoreductase [Mucilaginibacter myungsuensis]|uniref:TIGR01777 family protein n=1 Tax=Mucilaginibacter myungsuensis TaxID=649104 RepID=A0A929L2Z9_9SPHI|nr:TIGR01777 family oxidoreductase [Mucilaginibacter myungsuensis]MBE9664703.1 TIGR01777 family protein [Mucilaginibacter myungsuensis]MDN3601440.1 TIGR01777 family oxidoreductase [Mucilaginibacter myungsuensis]
MKYHKIVLAGGNGYIGRVLTEYFKLMTNEVIILSRRPAPADGNAHTIVWDGKTEGDWTRHLQGVDLLMNLCGKNVNCRYTDNNKQEIFDSRLIPTALLNKAIAGMSEPPKVFITVTSATIYRHADDRPQDEVTGEIGEGFSVDVCKAWEQTFFGTETPGTRKIALRMGFVLGKTDSAFPRLLNMARFGLGGPQGNGKQMTSWVHEQDVARLTEWLLDHPEAEGIFNCTAPNPITNSEMMRTIRQAIGMPIGLPSPEWLLTFGAWLIGTETELILKSRWVTPKRLLDMGFEFEYADIDKAVKACIK